MGRRGCLPPQPCLTPHGPSQGTRAPPPPGAYFGFTGEASPRLGEVAGSHDASKPRGRTRNPSRRLHVSERQQQLPGHRGAQAAPCHLGHKPLDHKPLPPGSRERLRWERHEPRRRPRDSGCWAASRERTPRAPFRPGKHGARRPEGDHRLPRRHVAGLRAGPGPLPLVLSRGLLQGRPLRKDAPLFGAWGRPRRERRLGSPAWMSPGRHSVASWSRGTIGPGEGQQQGAVIPTPQLGQTRKGWGSRDPEGPRSSETPMEVVWGRRMWPLGAWGQAKWKPGTAWPPARLPPPVRAPTPDCGQGRTAT